MAERDPTICLHKSALDFQRFLTTETKSFSTQDVFILLIGETGAGKSTLIDFLANFFRGGSVRNMQRVVQSHLEVNAGDTTRSQTRNCTTYPFSLGPVRFHLIDTPGIGDTDGPERDDENVAKIMLKAEAAGSLSAIIIVANGTNHRATTNVRTVLAKLQNSMPDSFEKNLVVALTNRSKQGTPYPVADLIPWPIQADRIFYMNNVAGDFGSQCSADEDDLMELEGYWNRSMIGIGRLLRLIMQLVPVSTSEFTTMRNRLDEIKGELISVMQDIRALHSLQGKIEGLIEQTKGADIGITEFAHFKQVTNTTRTILEDANFYSLLCFNHLDSICCEDCTVAAISRPNDSSAPSPFSPRVRADLRIRTLSLFDEQRGNRLYLYWCQKMDRFGSCLICGCGALSHFRAKKKMTTRTESIQSTLKEMKDKYDAACREKKDLIGQTTSAKSELEAMKTLLKKKEQLIEVYCQQIKRICKNFNFTQELSAAVAAMKANTKSIRHRGTLDDANRLIGNFEELITSLTEGASEATTSNSSLNQGATSGA